MGAPSGSSVSFVLAMQTLCRPVHVRKVTGLAQLDRELDSRDWLIYCRTNKTGMLSSQKRGISWAQESVVVAPGGTYEVERVREVTVRVLMITGSSLF